MFIKYQLLNDGEVKAYNDYHEAKKEATKQGLLLSEYGAVFGRDMAYAYWNESGNRNDDEKIIAYYKFDDNGKPDPISEKEFKDYIYR